MPVSQLGPHEIHEYQVYLAEKKEVAWSTLNHALSAPRFLCGVTLGKDCVGSAHCAHMRVEPVSSRRLEPDSRFAICDPVSR